MQIHSKHNGYTRDGRRTHHKGGGGGDGGAREMERERQARVAAATEQINNIFGNKVRKTIPNPALAALGSPSFDDIPAWASQPIQATPATIEVWEDGDPANSRDKLYADQRAVVYDLNKRDVDRQATVAERKNRFGLARNGQLGGSLDIDSNAEIGRVTNEGLLQAGGIADASAADLKMADERTRSNLISMAQSGIDTGSAASMALQGLDANARTAQSQRAGASIGSLFDNIGQAYYMNQVSQGARAGMARPDGQFFGAANPRTGDSGSVLR